MQWRVMVELTGSDGCVSEAIVATGERVGPGHTAATLGLTLTEGKAMIAALQQVVVEAQASEHCDLRRRCALCGALRPVKDHRARTLITPCGAVALRAPRFSRCRCGVGCQRSMTPVAEIMPDRCTPEYERLVALTGSSMLSEVERALTLIGETVTGLADHDADGTPAPAKKVIKLLRELETYVAGHASMIIDYATARKQAGPISTTTTESTVQRLLHRRMGANQHMRWSPRGAHLMLKVRTAVMNRAFTHDHAAAERFAHRPYTRAA